MRRGGSLATLALLLLLAPAARGEADNHPYAVQAVLVFAEHRFLTTELFQEQFPQELMSRVRLGLGPLVNLSVTRSHPLIDAIRREGLEAPLDAWEELSEQRTWFLSVRFEAGQFHAQARFFDGYTGLPGPLVRSVHVNDRAELAAAAARLLIDDFAVAGTVTTIDKDSVTLQLHGGGLLAAAPVVRVRAGDVFAVSRIALQGGRQKAQRLPWSVLEARAAPQAGTLACRFLHRFTADDLGGSGVSYRALCLPARSLPLRLRVIDEETLQPLAGVLVEVEGSAAAKSWTTDAEGFVESPQAIDRLAIVRLKLGSKPLARFPVPLLDETVVTCDVSRRGQADEGVALDIRRQQWLRRIVEARHLGAQRTRALEQVQKQSYEEARKHAEETIALLEREIGDLEVERSELVRRAVDKAAGQKALAEGVGLIGDLEKLRGAMKSFIVRVDEAIAQRNEMTAREQAAHKLAQQAALQETQGQYDNALALYDKARQGLPEASKLRKEVEGRFQALAKAWAIKSDEHAVARKFILEEWPTLEPERLRLDLTRAEKALEICRKSDDRLTPQRFVDATLQHLTKIGALVEKYRGNRSPEDRERAQEWTQLAAMLRELCTEAEDPKAKSKK